MITPEILKEFIHQSLSPEFLKGKSIYMGYNELGESVILINDDFIIFGNEVYIVKWIGPGNLKRLTIPLADPKASEKIREFLEEGCV